MECSKYVYDLKILIKCLLCTICQAAIRYTTFTKNLKKVQFKPYAKYGLYEAAHTSSRFGLQLPRVRSYQIQSKFVQQFRRLNLRNKCRCTSTTRNFRLFCGITSTTNDLIVRYVRGQKFTWQADTPKVRT